MEDAVTLTIKHGGTEQARALVDGRLHVPSIQQTLGLTNITIDGIRLPVNANGLTFHKFRPGNQWTACSSSATRVSSEDKSTADSCSRSLATAVSCHKLHVCCVRFGIHALLDKEFSAGTTSVQAGQFDQLVYEIMELCFNFGDFFHCPRLSCPVQSTAHMSGQICRPPPLEAQAKRGRLSLVAKETDLCELVRNALFFKGQHKSEEGKLDEAVAELKQTMPR